MTLDEDLVKMLRHDYKTSPISAQDMAMLDYAVQLKGDACCWSCRVPQVATRCVPNMLGHKLAASKTEPFGDELRREWQAEGIVNLTS